MSNLIVSVPNDSAGDIAIATMRRSSERQAVYRYIEDLSDRISPEKELTSIGGRSRTSQPSRAAEILRQLPAHFHLIAVRDGAEGMVMRDFMGLHRDAQAESGERGFILDVEPEWPFTLCALRNGNPTLRLDHTQYLSQLQVPNAHAKLNYGDDVKVALIDTGCDPSVSINDFYDVLNTSNYHPGVWGAVDNLGHGTAMAKIIRDVAPKCDLSVIRVADQAVIPLWHILAGVAIAVIEAEADIINLSLGLVSIAGTCSRCGASGIARSFALEYLLKSLRKHASSSYPTSQPPVLVAATGNDGQGNGFYLPANYDVCLAVGSVNRAVQRSSFSTYGNYAHLNYVVAPGGEVTNSLVTESAISDNAQPYYGTSISAAYTSGVLALFRHDHPNGDLMRLATTLAVPASPTSECGSGQIIYS
jgi:hypothetical protein